ncbi:MAG: hypothetical protein ACT6FG_05075 [Methanosarcinaceae archaeon]
MCADRACQYSGHARDRGAGSYVKGGDGGLVVVSGNSGFCRCGVQLMAVRNNSGFVTDVLNEIDISEYDRIYTCNLR